MADTRTYIRLHDGMPDHPKIDGLSDRAFRLLVETWCWCSRHLTDGHVPAATWVKRGTQAARQELIHAGLAETTSAGSVKMHDYLQHQRSADEVAELRNAKQEAGRKGGLARSKTQAGAQAGAKAGAQAGAKAGAQAGAQANGKQDASIDRDIDRSTFYEGTRPDVERLCVHLADRIEANGSKRPDVGKSWLDAGRLLLDRDGKSEQQVHTVIDWCQSSDFWRSNVLSMSKLREKFDTLRLQAERDGIATVHLITRAGENPRYPHPRELELPPNGLSPKEYADWERGQREKRKRRDSS